ncbi:MAG: copper amine oxidase N-terminal domain-containing protein [Bacillota bacterium]
MAGRAIKLLVDGKEILPDVPPKVIGGRVMVPLRWVTEALGARVDWDESTFTVAVQTPAWGAERRVAMLEAALVGEDPVWVANAWADAVKNRNGAVQFALLSPELREKYRPAFEQLGWVTWVSGPWVESYQVSCTGQGGIIVPSRSSSAW